MTITAALHAVLFRSLGLVISCADLLLPKKADHCVFAVGSGNAFSGNLKALHDHMRDSGQCRTVIVAHSTSDLTLCEDADRAGVIDVRSVTGLWCLLTSKTIIVEYWSGDWFWPGVLRRRHTILNLWHGIPIKRVGLAEGNRHILRESRRISMMIASSEVDRAMMSSCFGIPYPDVLLAGYPRNDRLLQTERSGDDDALGRLEQRIRAMKGEKRLVLYAPTYRGHHHSTGHSASGVYSFTPAELVRLKQMLKEQNALLAIRPHINRASDLRIDYDDTIIDMSRSVVGDVQVLLRQTDVLISDYSGVWVDYLLLDRPVIGFAYDWNQYGAERGYLYDYAEVFPGPMAQTFDEMASLTEKALRSSEPPTERQLSRKRMFHTFTDGRSCARIEQEIIVRSGAASLHSRPAL